MMEKKSGRRAEVSVSKTIDMEKLQKKIDSYSNMLYRIAYLQLKTARMQRMWYRRLFISL